MTGCFMKISGPVKRLLTPSSKPAVIIAGKIGTKISARPNNAFWNQFDFSAEACFTSSFVVSVSIPVNSAKTANTFSTVPLTIITWN